MTYRYKRRFSREFPARSPGSISRNSLVRITGLPNIVNLDVILARLKMRRNELSDRGAVRDPTALPRVALRWP
jgi:hypothetical protein